MSIKNPLGVRLWALVVALLLVAAGTIYGLFCAWDLVHQLGPKLTHSRLERFEIANQARRELQGLNNSVLRYALLRDPELRKQFDQTSGDLDHWIDSYDPNLNPKSPLTTQPEREVFAQLNRAYDDYVAAARDIYSNAEPVLVNPSQLKQLDAFDSQAERMRLLVHDLSEAHRKAEAAFLSTAETSMVRLRQILVAGVILLLALVAAMASVVYRDTIAPLRVKLVLSQNLLEKQEKLATLGTLAAGIAHEIRNPLTSLKARLYTLEKHLQVVPAAKRDTDIIGSEISRLERIVRDVLSFARPSAPCLETVEAQKLLSEVHELMAPDMNKRNLRLAVESGPKLLICADSAHLKQALINLVRNAAEATESEGTVTLRARAGVASFGKHEEEAAVLEVVDNGKGILPEVEKRLFDPFFTTKEAGTGLGLPIAARIVEKHGGMVQYHTCPGHGTTFGIVLPRQNKETFNSAKCAQNSAD